MRETIGERAARSTTFLLLRRVVGYVIRFAVIGVLARELTVAAFGIVAIATTCIGIMTMFGAGGINTWVIYDRDPGWEQRARSAWWLNAFITAGQALLAGALIPLVVWIYDERTLAPVLGVLIATFVIEQMRVVPYAILERRLEFRAIATRDMVYDILTGVIGVAMAVAGMGLWSLVLPRLILAPIFLGITLRLADWTPGARLYRADWKRILAYSTPLIGSSLLHTIANNGDKMIVGKLLGKLAVGYYNTAYLLANLVGRNVTSVLVQVSTPALAQMKEARGEIGSTCVRLYRVVAVITTPMLAGMFAIADDLVLLIYGPKWLPVIPLLRVFIVFTLVRSITSPSGAVLNVVGRTDLSFRMYALLTPLVLGGVVVGSYFGVLGVAIGVTAARVFVGFVGFALSLAVVEARVRDGFSALVPSTVAAGAMALLVWLARGQLELLGAPLVLRLVLACALGVVSYLVCLRLVSASAFREMIAMVSKMSPKLKRVLRRVLPAPEAGTGR